MSDPVNILSLNLGEAGDFELYPNGEERTVEIVRAEFHLSQNSGRTSIRIMTQDAREPEKYYRVTSFIPLPEASDEGYNKKAMLQRIKKFADIFSLPYDLFDNLSLDPPDSNPLVGRTGIVTIRQEEDNQGNPRNSIVLPS